MTYWHNCVVCSTNFYLPPGIFSPNAPNFILKNFKLQGWLWGASAIQLPSLLTSIILQQHPRLPTSQNRLSQASTISCIVLHNSAAAECLLSSPWEWNPHLPPSGPSANWLWSFFWSPNFLSFLLIIKSSTRSLFYIVTTLFLYQIESAKPHSIKIVHLSTHSLLPVFNR